MKERTQGTNRQRYTRLQGEGGFERFFFPWWFLDPVRKTEPQNMQPRRYGLICPPDPSGRNIHSFWTCGDALSGRIQVNRVLSKVEYLPVSENSGKIPNFPGLQKIDQTVGRFLNCRNGIISQSVEHVQLALIIFELRVYPDRCHQPVKERRREGSETAR